MRDKPKSLHYEIMHSYLLVIANLVSLLCMLTVSLQRQYQNFLRKHPDGQISRKSFHSMMKECYPGTDTEKLERHIFRMYDTNKVILGIGWDVLIFD